MFILYGLFGHFQPQRNINKCFHKRLSLQKKNHQRAEEHKESENLKNCAKAYLLRANNANVKQLLFSKQLKEREEQVTKRRQVMEKMFDVVRVIGKRGLSYRGHSESAHTLGDEGTDHGFFIEIHQINRKILLTKRKLLEAVET